MYNVLCTISEGIECTLGLGNKAKPKCMPIRPSLNIRIFYSHANKAKPPQLGLALLPSTGVYDIATANITLDLYNEKICTP